MKKKLEKKCDNCMHYHWYYDYCDKWKCEVDAREIHDCCEVKTHEQTTVL